MAVTDHHAGDEPTGPVPQPRSEWSRRWGRYRRNRLAVLGLGIVTIAVLMALTAPVLAPHGYADINPGQEFLPAFSPDHLMGTDLLGRDLLSRLIYSLRTALFIAVAAELLSLAIAFAVGLAAGYRGGKVDQWLMAGTDVMYAFPGYLFAVLLVAVMGRSTWAVILALTIASWVGQSRLLRAQIMRLKTLEYVEAGRAMGATGFTLVMRYMVPNALGPVLVSTSFGIPANMLAESGLAILGLGVAPPVPSLGTMIIDGYRFVLTDPGLIAWPVGIFVLIMLAFTWVGDGVRDAFDVDES
ncbi:ABC transporter permease [Ruania alba]|uniref:Peptide/nickel transport system permease protein n=1 Tax=Ruania alba TaxID=648782 RepID=A0A1H5MTV4_9MICO|nr:ABC transporter permease [Ruania alba]SEE91798.1 peptide/nickel transport system permease protein [Ruania alba]